MFRLSLAPLFPLVLVSLVVGCGADPSANPTLREKYSANGNNQAVNQPAGASPCTPLAFSYSPNPAVYTVGVEIIPNIPSNAPCSDFGYFWSNQLPAGLSMDTSTGVITGVPSSPGPMQTYSIYAVTSSLTYFVVALNIQVNNPAPKLVSLEIVSADPSYSGTVYLGCPVQFRAMGIYSDGSEQDLTSSLAGWVIYGDLSVNQGLVTAYETGSILLEAVSAQGPIAQIPLWIARFPGDANADGLVNGLDFALISANWLKRGYGGIPGDVNLDGIVNGLDIAEVASQWSKSCR